MTDQHAELDAALERVVEAARAHLSAVKVASGRVDDDDVWQAYVTLNNATYEYDDLLFDAFGEVTPWEVDFIDPAEADGLLGVAGAESKPTDPYPRVLSVRQRRDFWVPSVAALIGVAEAARMASVPEGDEPEPVEGVGEAVLELLQAGDGSLAALDVPELEPLDGVVMLSEVSAPLDLDAFDDEDGVGPFQPAADDRLIGRLDEHPFLAEAGEEESEPVR